MSQDPNESAEKSHEPTPKKLEDARRKGEIAKSVDLTTAAAYGGMLLVLIAFGATSLSQFGSGMTALVARADDLSALWFRDGAHPLSAALAGALARPLATWFLLPALAALLAIIAQRAFVVAPDKLQPKLNRVSPIANLKNKFGKDGLFEFAKSTAKLSIYSAVLALFLVWRMPQILATAQLEPTMGLTALGRMSIEFLAIVVTVAGSIGVVDLLWQHQAHLRKNRMSRKELMDETKQTEGDPHLKQQRRQRGYDIATNKMLGDVPDADVVVVNPEHYAVALKWSRAPGSAPICVAKGVDEIAARIREIAAEAGVPIHRDPPTARAMYASVEIGAEIRPEQYKAVAAAIRFAERMRTKSRAQRGT
ncbi:MAG: flagellar type III secretion system protein FlhB [Rhodobacter sp.]|nr:flagellar type III secretion system protein FlhB [Rhodobacter sp.]